MAYDPLLEKVMSDYGPYFNRPQQRFAEGGNVPAHDLNLAAWEQALKNKPKIEKEKYSYKGYPITYKNGKWEEDVPDITTQVLVPMGMGGGMGGYQPGGFGMPDRGVYDASGQPYKPGGMLGGGSSGQMYVYQPKTEKGYLLQYEYDPRLYIWDEYGRNIGKKPELFGGSLGGLSMAGLGNDMFNVKSAVKGFADGGYVNSGMQDLLERYPDENTVQQLPEQPIAAAPNFVPITQGQVEPSGGGYVPATAAQANPQLAAINPDLYALMQQYTTGPDYSAELKRVGEERRTAEAGFNKALESAMSGADQGPSKAELYFRLAAAFGTPSKTGAFAEGLGQAAGAAAEYKKEERTAQTAKRKLATDILLKKQELALEGVKDREKTLLALQSDNAKDRREAIKGIINEYIQSGKPQSEAGKIAKDKGFKVGTPEYQEEVDKQAKILLENKLASIQATLGGLQIAGAKLALETKKEERAASELDSTELKLLTENKQAIKSTQSALDLMEEAATLADKAFTKSTADQAEYKRLKTTDPQHPRVVATEQLEQILTTSGLAGLRSSFGGNPTEGERNVQLLTQGLGATSAASRKQIINRVKNGLVKNKAFYDESNADLLSGSYKKKPVTKE